MQAATRANRDKGVILIERRLNDEHQSLLYVLGKVTQRRIFVTKTAEDV
jgi:hypothetical protein